MLESIISFVLNALAAIGTLIIQNWLLVLIIAIILGVLLRWFA